MEKKLKCAFTGHRIIKITKELKDDIKKEIISLINKGVAEFLNGGALGFDLLCAQIVTELKKEYPIKLKMILPCKDQSARWNESQKLYYEEILYKADEIKYIADSYEPGCMQRRNKELICECDYLLSYCMRESGGSYNTVKEAKKAGKTVINLSKNCQNGEKNGENFF